ncbi:MAG TPA: LssY C-terminal domain-containing protein [Edaphobacter sp.]|nr:LssY C-terminal domain-containing protein [Edaphobacter sp.]
MKLAIAAELLFYLITAAGLSPACAQTESPSSGGEQTSPTSIQQQTPVTSSTSSLPLAVVKKLTAEPGVQPIVSMREKRLATAAAIAAHKKKYELTLDGADWLDTGAMVSAGEVISFTASGTVTLADGRQATADGLDRGWKDLLRQFPLNSAKVGALVGRVGNADVSVPFLMGTSGQATMPTTGELYLRINTSSDLSFTGSYKVELKFIDSAKAAAASAPAPPISSLIKPAIFADIPRRVSDVPSGEGHPGDMVNFAMVGSKEQVEAAFKAAGWVAVDKSVQDAILNGLLKTLSHEAYTAMPMSTLYLFGRPQDLSFARADPLMVAAERHHLRVWQTDQTIDGRPLWVGSATHDIGFETDQRTGGVTHKIDPEIDKERDYLVHSFDAAGAFSSAAYVTPANPLRDAKTATGGSFQSDGRIAVMELK